MELTFQQLQAFEEAARRFSKGQIRQPERQENRRGGERLFRTLEKLRPDQLAIHDAVTKDGQKFIALFTTRRWGKSYLVAPWFVEIGMLAKDPETTMFIIAPTLEHAKGLFWRKFEDIKRDTGLDFQMKNDPVRIEFPTGATIYFRGAKDMDQLGPLKGYKVAAVWVDEAQDIRSAILKHISNALGASLRDLHGFIGFSGTPGLVRAGEWYNITTGQKNYENWKVFTGSLFDNYFLDEEARDINTICREEGITPESPRFKREYLGQWVEDDSLFIYKYDLVRNGKYKHNDPLPEADWSYVMGIDFGYSPDPSAVCVVAYSNQCRTTFVVDEWKRKECLYEELYQYGIKPFLDKYGSVPVIGDNAEKQGIEELNRRWGLGVQKSEKRAKLTFIELANSELTQGYIQIPAEFDLAREMSELVWDPSKLPERKEHPRRDNHLCDAFLYAWRKTRSWLQVHPDKLQSFGSENEKEAYFLKQYIHRQHSKEYKLDLTNDSNFRSNNGNPFLGKTKWRSRGHHR